jgi:ectoine hydroxylase-related dioxygenase (phytanoyl-CoA dioxygenase family)
MTELSPSKLNIDQFDSICQQAVNQEQYPLAHRIESRVLFYKGEQLREHLASDSGRHKILNEFRQALSTGPGVLVIENAYADSFSIDDSNRIFEQILTEEAKLGISASDHFAKAGSNGRIWNVFQKTAFKSASTFIDYYSNPLLAVIAESWLGPGYQITAQVNQVKPGNSAQAPHRDYHLGFQNADQVMRYPLHAQLMSQYLTLQGGVAHTDMPIESGPTVLLPFSHQYQLGYQAWREPKFNHYFKQHSVQFPLKKGDALFFNPALFHGAGENRSADLERIANLLQISSAFGKPMESVDSYDIAKEIYPILLDKVNSLDPLQLKAIISASADGYSFPSNLDTDPPLLGMAPQTAQALLSQALEQQWTTEKFHQAMDQHRAKRNA